jgi:hypothetical protein
LTNSELENYANQCGLNQLLHMDGVEGCLEHFADLIAQHEREECKKLCTWKTGNKFVDEAIAVCYRAIDLRGKA